MRAKDLVGSRVRLRDLVAEPVKPVETRSTGWPVYTRRFIPATVESPRATNGWDASRRVI